MYPEKTGDLLEKSFDDTEILRRGIELIMKRKENNKI